MLDYKKTIPFYLLAAGTLYFTAQSLYQGYLCDQIECHQQSINNRIKACATALLAIVPLYEIVGETIHAYAIEKNKISDLIEDHSY